MNIYPIFALLSFSAMVILGALVFAGNTKNPVNRVFLAFSIFIGFSNLTIFGSSMAKDVNTAHFWSMAIMIFPMAYFLQYHLVLLSTTKLSKINNKLIISGYVFTILFSFYCMFNFHSEIIEKGNNWINLSRFQKSDLWLLKNLYRIVFVSLALFQAGRYILTTKDRSRRIQMGLFIVAILLPSMSSILENMILPALHIEKRSDSVSVFSFLASLFYAFSIWKYQLFNITPEFAASNIISTIRDGLILINNEGVVLSANKAFIKLSGLEESHLIGYPVNVFFDRCIFTDLDIPKLYLKKELKNQPFKYNALDSDQLYMQFSNTNVVNKSGKKLGCVCIIADITSYVQIQHELKVQNQDMLTLAHRAGMAEIATGVMHNIGNLMNSLSISAEKIIETLKNSKLPGFSDANKLLLTAVKNPAEFFGNNPQGKLLPQYYSKLAATLENEHNRLRDEGSIIVEKVLQIKDAIEIQQDVAKSRNFNETVKVISVIDEALKILETSMIKHDIIVRKKIRISNNLEVQTSRTRLMNILLNLLKNAMESIIQQGSDTRIIEIVVSESGNMLQISIVDNGVGIAGQDQLRLFNYGFTTKTGGHGFGLHFCANAVKEMDGTIEAYSEGKSKGAEFKISIPKMASNG